ncbi:T9SS type A sorting domain-containing protein [Patescibacteria group bacterium]|nr:T9SS type A sorting domain-containing protein [Patescibacteria group bacterium]
MITRYTFIFSVKIETQDLKSGIYILRIISKSKVETLQIIKQ